MTYRVRQPLRGGDTDRGPVLGTPPERGILPMVIMLVHPYMYKEHEAYQVSDYTHPGIPLRPPLHKATGGPPPRMRGEQVRQLARAFSRGSPPRIAGNAPFTIQEEPTPPMRGTHHFSTVGAAIVRPNPAYAGSTDYRAIRDAGQRDHPRVCREHTCTPRDLLFFLCIIPAYEGNT